MAEMAAASHAVFHIYFSYGERHLGIIARNFAVCQRNYYTASHDVYLLFGELLGPRNRLNAAWK